LESERNELLEGVERAEKQMRDMENRARELEARCLRAEADRAEVLRDRAEIEDELERLRVGLEDAKHEKRQIEQEQNAVRPSFNRLSDVH
jgi:chromosome segregation ATPase